MVFYLAGDKDICTVADGKRHQESAGAATQCNSLYFPPEEFVMSETPYFEGFSLSVSGIQVLSPVLPIRQ